jgi:exodeoxyribonuclease V alpha subunit
MAENLSGIIERVTFHNPENGFAVLRVHADERPDLVTVVGHMANALAGETIEASGAWINDREHGLQFKAEQIQTAPPQSAKAIERYLGSGLVKGIGPHFARKIVAVFGDKTLDVIDESPAFLHQVKGLGSRRIQRIRQSWQEQKAVRAIMLFLQAHGVGTVRALRIYRTYGDRAIELVKENPYRLATDIWGIGFQTADQLAGRLGIDRASPLRARAALRYVLKQLGNEGHVGFPEAGLIQRTAELTRIDPGIIADAANQELAEGELVRERVDAEEWIYLKPLYLAETGAARALRNLRDGRHPLPAINTESALGWVEGKMNLQLAASQREAIRQAASQKVLVITGGPGVGKTTIVRGILEIFAAKDMRCALCAPTGRAAKRLAESTGREAKTIHRLLEFDPASGGFQHDRDRPLDVDLLVVDEASMVDVSLAYQLLRAIPPGACVVLVGDVDQLPSVGPGTVLADIIASRAVPVVRLKEIFRQAGQSLIVRAAHQVNQGEMPESAPTAQGDFFFVNAASPEAILERIIALVQERIPVRFGFDPLRDIQVLTPMNRSLLGARNLNERLQAALNPPANQQHIDRYGSIFRLGDKVLQTVNDYQKEVFNGDIGRISRIDEVDQEVTVDYDGRPVVYDLAELDELALAYALTIHKSQGSEYPAVVIPLHTQHYLMLQRNLLYTGITRGKKLVVLVGSKKALSIAVLRQDNSRRYTALERRLQADI